MKYLAFIIAGLIFGAFSDDGWGVLVGGVLGFVLAWAGSLSRKVNLLESKLLDLESKQFIETTSSTQQEIPEEPVSSPLDSVETVVEVGEVDSTPAVAMQVESEIDLSLQQHQETQEALNSDALDEKAVAELETAKQMDEETQEDSHFKRPQETEVATKQLSETTKAEPVSTEPSAISIAIDNGLAKIKDWVVGYFTGGNSLVRTGMLVLFVGVAFLLKYVAERTVVPVEFRYVGIVAGSLVLLILGWRLRHKRPGFALSLQGGGIGVLYLTLFAAMRLHQLLPASAVLLCLIGIVVLSATLAVLQNSMALAVIGVLGGFAAPILTSTGSGSHVQLFAYYLLLNISVFGIAWFKSWRLLNLLGFFATFAVGSLWGIKYYQPAYFSSVEPFLIAHFLLYVLIAVFFAFKQPPNLKGINDGTLIFGTPIVVFSLQAGLVKDMTYGLAYSALILGVFYISLAFIVKQLHRPYFKNLIESFIALGVGFATLAIPLGFDGRVTSAMWVAEASAMVWVGVRQQRILPRFSGYALALLGSLAFFVEPAGNLDVLPFLNADFVGVLIVVAASLFMGLYARKHAEHLLPIESPWVTRMMVISAICWWTMGGFVELEKHFSEQSYLLFQLWMLTTVVILLFWGQRLAYRLMIVGALILNGLMLFVLIDIPGFNPNAVMFWNIRFLTLLVVAMFYLRMAVYWQQTDWLQSARWKILVSRYFLVVGVLLWLLAMTLEIHKFLPIKQLLWKELLMATTAGLLLWYGHRRHWDDFKWMAVIVTLLMLVPVFLTLGTQVWFIPSLEQDPVPVFNVSFMAILIYFVTHFLVGNYWQKNMLESSKYSWLVSRTLLALALFAWVLNGMIEADKYFTLLHWIPVVLAFVSASFVLFIWAAHHLNWLDLHEIKYGMTPLLLFLAVLIPNYQDFHEGFGWLSWLIAFMVNYWILKVYDHKDFKLTEHYHVLSLWVLSYVLVYEFAALLAIQLGYENIWYSASFTGSLWVISTLVYSLRTRLTWPLLKHAKAYFQWAMPVMIWTLWLLVMILNTNDPGDLLGIPYLPVLNIIDILGLLVIWLAIKLQQNNENGLFIKDMKFKYALLAGTAFLMLNATMLRCFHYWYGIDYQLNDLMSSFMVQTGFSILWAATAVTLMVLAARKYWRHVWLLGLGLMILVVAKLFLVDMSASGSIERIVAFLTVGFLLSLVGYFSPLPPDINKGNETKGENHEA